MGGKSEMEGWNKAGGASHNVPVNKNKMITPNGYNTPKSTDVNSSANRTTGTPPVK